MGEIIAIPFKVFEPTCWQFKIVWRNVTSGGHSWLELACVNGRRRLLFQPLESPTLVPVFASDSPSAHECREYAVNLRRPVWLLAAGASCPAVYAGQEFDLQNEAHESSDSSPPEPSSASFRLLWTISTNLSCGVSLIDSNRNPTDSAKVYASLYRASAL